MKFKNSMNIRFSQFGGPFDVNLSAYLNVLFLVAANVLIKKLNEAELGRLVKRKFCGVLMIRTPSNDVWTN